MKEPSLAQKWTIRELTPDEYPDTQLRYEVRDETEVVSLHYWEEDARQMAAVPLLRDALYDALAYIEEVARDFGVEPEKDVLKRITAALEASGTQSYRECFFVLCFNRLKSILMRRRGSDD
jgi:hypothetical protein